MGNGHEQSIRTKACLQRGFSFVEIMVSLAVIAVLASVALPYVTGVINTNQNSSIAQLFQENLRQARYASRINTNQVIVFCALTSTDNSRCQLNPARRNQFSHGWQWFIDSYPDKQFNIDADTLLGNTTEIKHRQINASTLPSDGIISQNAITFSNGEMMLTSTNGDAIIPTITFSKENGKTSAVIFQKTGTTTFLPRYLVSNAFRRMILGVDNNS